jgi:transcriptional regulator with XRE-family HTH domain
MESGQAQLADMRDNAEGEMVTRRRKRLGMTISGLAALAGVDRDTLSKWEQGEREPQGSTAGKIRKALETREYEVGMPPIDSPPAEPHIRVIKIQIGEVAVEGPVETAEELAELEESALRLSSRLARGLDDPSAE